MRVEMLLPSPTGACFPCGPSTGPFNVLASDAEHRRQATTIADTGVQDKETKWRDADFPSLVLRHQRRKRGSFSRRQHDHPIRLRIRPSAHLTSSQWLRHRHEVLEDAAVGALQRPES